MLRAHVFITGLVQGVGFRHFTQRKGEQIGARGWVRNLSDGRVEALLVGTQEQVNEMIQFCKNGPYGAKVEKVDVEWVEGNGEFEAFEIR